MLDKKTERMLQAASMLTAEDLDGLRGTTVAVVSDVDEDVPEEDPPVAAALPEVTTDAGPSDPSRGERERQRTRESKVSTSCIGRKRENHEWWPVGTELTGRVGSETFTATVVENAGVKSGRSILLTSGPATGKMCLTPTRAAIEATEAYRQSQNWGRAGVTNGWTFWKPAS